MPKFRFISADCDSSTSVHARVTVEIESEGTQKEAMGEHRDKFAASVFEATRNAVFQLTGLRPAIRGVSATVGGGRKKCEAEVQLAVRKNGQRIVGKAEYADGFQAEVAAYIDALNQLD